MDPRVQESMGLKIPLGVGEGTNLENGLESVHQAGDTAHILDGAQLHLLDLGLCGLRVVYIAVFVSVVGRGAVLGGIGAIHLHGVGVGLLVGAVGEAILLLDIVSLVTRAAKVVEQILGDGCHGDCGLCESPGCRRRG